MRCWAAGSLEVLGGVGESELWQPRVPFQAYLCEKPPSEGCGGFQSLEVPKEEPWLSPATDREGALRAGVFAGLPLPFINHLRA